MIIFTQLLLLMIFFTRRVQSLLDDRSLDSTMTISLLGDGRLDSTMTISLLCDASLDSMSLRSFSPPLNIIYQLNEENRNI